MIRKILCGAVAVGLAALAWGIEAPAGQNTKTPVTKAPAKRPTASRSTKKPAAAPRTTWRNRQAVPTPERYKEIQNALVSKGYLQPEEAGGGWGASSTDALKRFQAAQNLESSGKINALSLIALGLGPRRDPVTAPVKPPAPVPEPPIVRQ